MTDKQATARKVSAGIEFHGRKMDFGFKFEDLPRYWYGNDAFKSTLMNALSCLFLEGERLFIDAVRDNEHHVKDEHLKAQVKNFIKRMMKNDIKLYLPNITDLLRLRRLLFVFLMK